MNDKAALQEGGIYLFDHARKGRFVGRVVAVGDDFAEVAIVEGEATMLSARGNAQEGEVIRIRLSLAMWKPAAQPPSPSPSEGKKER